MVEVVVLIGCGGGSVAVVKAVVEVVVVVAVLLTVLQMVTPLVSYTTCILHFYWKFYVSNSIQHHILLNVYCNLHIHKQTNHYPTTHLPCPTPPHSIQYLFL